MTTRTAEQLRRDALAIWRAGVAAVDSRRLVEEALRIEGGELVVADEVRIELADIERIAVVGAGKAGAGMAAGVEAALGETLMRDKQVTGWLNVPADCVPLVPGTDVVDDASRRSRSARGTCGAIHLHAARPAGVNEPTEAGAAGSAEILKLAGSLGERDLCLCLISGGGSALLPAPVEGISLADKLAVTRFLSGAGANIQQLNTVRKQLSRIKGGGLLRACRAGRLITLIISDVIGDPLDIIGSGPTVEDPASPADAIAVLDQFGGRQSKLVPAAVYTYLDGQPARRKIRATCRADNFVIGNNAAAVDAAGLEAVRLGYSPAMIAAQGLEGAAEDVGRRLADMALYMRRSSGPDCLISGGEPVVQLVPAAQRGLGGRNQQLVLAALERLGERTEGLSILSGGTDGEDGPTDAAGAFVDGPIAHAAAECGLNASDNLRRNDAYRFFEPLGGLIKTGPTHTNVCDVRVVLVDRTEVHSNS